MKIHPFLLLSVLAPTLGCAHQWVHLAENETTEYFLDTQSAVQTSESVWEVRERFLEKVSDRWSLETYVRYDCEERTFMTLRVREFREYRPVRRFSELEGNEPVVVTPGSEEEARLDAVCAALEAGRGG